MKFHGAAVAIVITAGTLLAACGAGTSNAKGAPTTTRTSRTPAADTQRFTRVASQCGVSYDLQDEGKSLTFDTEGNDDAAGSGDTIDDVACVLNGLDCPDYVIDHMDATRALDGMQTDTWKGVKARWTYHPDEGMVLILVDAQA